MMEWTEHGVNLHCNFARIAAEEMNVLLRPAKGHTLYDCASDILRSRRH